MIRSKFISQIAFAFLASVSAFANEGVKISLTPAVTVCQLNQNGNHCSLNSSTTYNETIELESSPGGLNGQTLREIEVNGLLFKYLINIDKQQKFSGSRYVVQAFYFVSSGTKTVATDLLGYVITLDPANIASTTFVGEKIRTSENTYLKPTVRIQAW